MNKHNYKDRKLMIKDRIIFIIFILSLALSPVYGEALNSKLYSESYFGAVSCGHPLGVNAALQILSDGGNAVDAAVACAFMLGVVDFSNSGLGGDGYGLICFPNGKVIAIDGSTKKPKAVKHEEAVKGLGSDIGLPTIPEMLLKMLRIYGSRWPAEVMSPAILTCIKGFPVSAYLEKVTAQKLISISDPNAIEFLAPRGYPIRAGHWLKQPRLANTLMKMSRDGGISFYKGDCAKETIGDMESKGAAYDLVDFATCRSSFVMPAKATYKDFTIYGTPPPSSSLATMEMAVKLLEKNYVLFPQRPRDFYRLAKLGRETISKKYFYINQCLDNAKKYGGLSLDKENKYKKNVTLEKVQSNSNTTHLSVIDRNGLAVSLTLTLGSHFGTGEMAPGGYFYNNGMRNYRVGSKYAKDYSEKAGPVSSKSPIIVTKNNKVFLAIGGSGSDRIITNTALVMARALKGHSLSRSVASNRFFLDQNNRLHFEWQPDVKVLNQLKNYLDGKAGFVHRQGCADYFGLVSGVKRDETGLISTAGDQRRDGACGVILK